MRDRSRLFRLTLAVAVAVITSTLIAPVQPASAAEGDLATETLVAAGDVWSYYDNGTDPGGTWNQPTYDDTPWQTGNGQFGYGDGDETTLINYGPDPQNKYATTYFRKTLNLTNTHQLINATATLTYDDGAIIYLNGTQIHHTGNIPNNHTHQTWANQNREETITIPLNPNLLTNGQNTIAVEIHQAWRKSNDISFDLTIEATRQILGGLQAPTVVNDEAEAFAERELLGTVAANDRANDAGALTWYVESNDRPDPPTVGTLTFSNDGTYRFTSAADFLGTVVVPYEACNGGACDFGTLTITVEANNYVTRSLGLLAPVHIVDPGPIDLVVGEAIDVAIDYQVTDGIFSYEWLSPGLTGTVDGHISGTPTEAGSNTAHITLVDLAGNRVEALVLLTVRAGAPTGDPTEHPAIDATTLEVRPEQNQHGVIGLNLNDSTVADVRVWDMQQLGNHMYLGGEFQQVQLGDDGAVIDQAFLARFNLATGHYDPTFTPDLDGNVHALEVSPNGLLLVGGEFTSIDGVVNSAAIAAINPATGAVDTGFRTSMERPWSSNEPVIRELEVVGDLLYVTGNFSHLRDRLTNKRERVYKLARLNAATGEADLTWRPRVTGGSVYGLAIDQDRGRVMLTGSFTSVDGIASTAKLALIDTVIGDVIGDTMPDTAWKIFDIEYANDMIFLANGWNNQISVHDADTFEVIHHYESDGDFQFIEKVGDNVYAGCHCTQDPSFPTARVLSAVTGLELDLQFDIGGNIDGAWSVATDSLGCVWIGGDILDGGFDGARVWARGFARFCQQDQPANPGLGGAL